MLYGMVVQCVWPRPACCDQTGTAKPQASDAWALHNVHSVYGAALTLPTILIDAPCPGQTAAPAAATTQRKRQHEHASCRDYARGCGGTSAALPLPRGFAAACLTEYKRPACAGRGGGDTIRGCRRTGSAVRRPRRGLRHAEARAGLPGACVRDGGLTARTCHYPTDGWLVGGGVDWTGGNPACGPGHGRVCVWGGGVACAVLTGIATRSCP